MGELQSNKRKRVYSFQPNTITTPNFYHNYMSHLLPALLEARKFQSLHGSEDKEEVLKTVRFEVDVALVEATAATGFGWSRALRRRLERDTKRSQPQLSFCVSPTIGRTVVPDVHWMGSEAGGFGPRRGVRKKRRRSKCEVVGGEDLGSRVQTLRTILPGGKEMDVCELLSEVGSYLVCLELQVSILQSLLGRH